ncbi:MAG: glucose-6-phosphate dehydrogenase [Candidatus Diapherotrites archaeon]|nr:glucose-6-phosphate dehydrogenase [Candidatus Diapherotrites archaeon]
MPEETKPVLFVVFGATGDLFNRKLAPAFYKMYHNKVLSDRFALIGVGRREKTDAEFRTDIEKAVRAVHKGAKPDELVRLQERTLYANAPFEDDAGYAALLELIRKTEQRFNTGGNRIFYLATLPEHFGVIAGKIKQHGLDQTTGFCRVIIEKPFGNDLLSATKLNSQIARVFSEEQIFRIDHYLGKELVQNLLVSRFANDIFKYPWNRKFIDHVQILVAEENGIGNRGQYFEKAGVLNDMVQNHILQLVALTAMDAPKSMSAKDITAAKIKVLQRIHYSSKTDPNPVVLGQYEAGTIDDKPVVGYRAESNVTTGSKTPTFAAIRFEINNKNWKGVPFYVRTGKRLPKMAARIWLEFKTKPEKLFAGTGLSIKPNHLEFRIQPDEGIALFFNVKVPGREMRIKQYHLDFCHECEFGLNTPEAYERLLQDCMHGDKTLFTSWKETRLAWKIMEPIAKTCTAMAPHPYAAGGWGPAAADELIARDGRRWHVPKEYGGNGSVY